MSEQTEIVSALVRLNLARADEPVEIVPLSGGVSCDVLRVTLPGRRLCVKRALAKLRVAADWRAPVERAHNEVAWLRFAATVDGRRVPAVLGEDMDQHLFAMSYLEPADHPCWKTLMLDGDVRPDFAREVARSLVAFHAASVGRPEVEARFAMQDFFYALRLEPYLYYTASAHPDRAAPIRAAADAIGTARIALMHGDVSPKNILSGPEGPIFLDAETACYGDPVFDLAFCLNHLLLKAAYLPARVDLLEGSWLAFRDAYLAGVGWEDRDGLARRTARLLAAFLLARIDGKSPVEYLTRESDKSFVREAARSYLSADGLTLDALFADFRRRLDAR